MTLLNASGRALSQSVTISGVNMSLREVFSRIESQTGYQFLYKAQLLKEAKPITLHIKNASVRDALHQCFDSQQLDFYIEDKTVFISRRPDPRQDRRQQPTRYLRASRRGRLRVRSWMPTDSPYPELPFS